MNATTHQKGNAAAGAPASCPNCLIVDDHPMTRQGLVSLIQSQPRWPVPTEAGDAQEALRVLGSHKVDLVITDLSFPGLSGLEWVGRLCELYPGVPVIVVSMHDERVFAPRVLRAGAKGYVMKDRPAPVTLRAIHVVLGGGVYVNPEIASSVISQLAGKGLDAGAIPTDHLTDRELEVYQMLGRGLTSEEIAQRMVISFKTVNVHRDNIKKKFNLKNLAQLIQHASQWVTEQAIKPRQ